MVVGFCIVCALVSRCVYRSTKRFYYVFCFVSRSLISLCLCFSSFVHSCSLSHFSNTHARTYTYVTHNNWANVNDSGMLFDSPDTYMCVWTTLFGLRSTICIWRVTVKQQSKTTHHQPTRMKTKFKQFFSVLNRFCAKIVRCVMWCLVAS